MRKTTDYKYEWYIALRNDNWKRIHKLCADEVVIPEIVPVSQAGFEYARKKLDAAQARLARLRQFQRERSRG